MDADSPLDAPATTPRAASYHPGTQQDRAAAQLAPLTPASPCLHHFFEAAALRWPDAVAVDVPPGRGRPERTLVT
jgi:hypothetical protein